MFGGGKGGNWGNNGKMGGGKGNGWNGGGEQMVTVPLHVLQSLQNNQKTNNGWGGGNAAAGCWGNPAKGGGGKGGKDDNSWVRFADPSLKVWIGGFPPGNVSNKETNQALKAHMGPGCKYAELGKKGTGCALFANAEQVQNAVATLNGSTFQGVTMQVDVYTKGSDAGQQWAPAARHIPATRPAPVQTSPAFVPHAAAWAPKGKGGGAGGKGGKVDNSWARYADPSLKVWIGGFPQGNSSDKEVNQALKTHMGPGCKYAEVGKKGTGFALYGSSDEVTNAIATLHGSTFQGTVMQLDVYEKGGSGN